MTAYFSVFPFFLLTKEEHSTPSKPADNTVFTLKLTDNIINKNSAP
uniref:Uncharacterized protein n=1 Tax=Bartonella rochalimae ATCC BAA-1498 TaxID=685782 RepID=E6YNK7_9HYPH|nr:hypothetical protein BARRO_130089 [Bartonella rochalimae ATCC BAA-1498]